MAYTPQQVRALLVQAGGNPSEVNFLTYASTKHEDPSGTLGVINNDPATGDYSVGLFQINYYGGLLQSRTRQFGSPQSLASNALEQAKAALSIFRSSGPGAWPTSYADLQAGKIPDAVGAGGIPVPSSAPVALGGQNQLTTQPAGGHGGSGGESLLGQVWGAVSEGAEDVEHAVGSAWDTAEKTIEDLITGPLAFLKLVTWLILPKTWLRAVETTIGMVLLLAGVLVALGADRALGKVPGPTGAVASLAEGE